MRTPKPQLHRWTKAQYHQMADLGWFDEQGQRVELIDGQIIDSPAPSPGCCMALSLTGEALRGSFGPKHWVRIQAPLDLGPVFEPQPDLAVMPGDIRDHGDEHPTTALLVIEVTDRTLSFDREQKGPLYASAGLNDFWIVNLVDRQLEVHRNPVADSAAPLGFRYADVTVHGPADFVSPLAVPSARIAVADLLP